MALGVYGGDPTRRTATIPSRIGGGFRSTSTTPIPVGSTFFSSTKPGTAPAAARPAAPAAGAVSLTAQPPPEFGDFMSRYKDRLAQMSGRTNPNLQTQVDRLGQRLSTDTTERAIGRAQGAIRDQASGQQAAAAGRAARRGVGGSGVEEQGMQQIDETSARRQAGAAADISLGRERDLDALVLGGQRIMEAPGEWQGGLDRDVLAGARGGMSASMDPAQLAIAQGRLGLDASRLDKEIATGEEDRELSLLMALSRMGGGGRMGGGY